MTVAETCELVLKAIQEEQSATSLPSYRWKAKMALRAWGAETELRNITRPMVREWIARRRLECAPATLRYEISFLRRLFQVNEEITGEELVDPTLGLKKPKVDNWACRPMMPAEEATIKENLPNLDFLPIEFALHTGLRRLEQWRLKPADVQLWTEKDGSLKGLATVRTSKTGKGRLVPLNPVAAAIAKVFLSQGRPYLMPGESQDRYKEAIRWTRRNFYARCRRLGLVGLSWHKLRHTCATRAIQKGARLEEVRLLLGHSSLHQTDRYVQWTDQGWAAAMRLVA